MGSSAAWSLWPHQRRAIGCSIMEPALLRRKLLNLSFQNWNEARRTLDDVVEQLTTQAAQQNGGVHVSKGETAKQRVLRLALRFNHMRPIVQIARLENRDLPDFEKFRMPAVDVSRIALIGAAH